MLHYLIGYVALFLAIPTGLAFGLGWISMDVAFYILSILLALHVFSYPKGSDTGLIQLKKRLLHEGLALLVVIYATSYLVFWWFAVEDPYPVSFLFFLVLLITTLGYAFNIARMRLLETISQKTFIYRGARFPFQK